MVTTMFLIGLLYVVLVGVLLAFVRGAWPVVLLVAGGLFVAQFWFSDRIAAHSMGAREVTREQAPELHGAVDRVCALADMPKPRVAISDMDLPNAFATGRSRDTALVCVTTGSLRRLEPEELEGCWRTSCRIVAHRDVMVMTVAAFLGVLAGIMARVGLWGGLGRSGGGRDSGAAIAVLLIPLISAAVYAVSFLLTRLLSRYRELSADRAAALLTGRPSASGVGADQGDRADGRHPDPGPAEGGAVQRLLVRAAFSSKDSLGRLLSSHPTLEQRLEQLARISARLGR